MQTTRNRVRSWRRRGGILAAIAVTLGMVGALPALATVSNPTPGQVVAGIVPINDSGPTGGAAACGITTAGSIGQLYARVEVHRVNAAGVSVERVFTETRTASAAIPDDPGTPDVDESAPAVPKGAWTAQWDTTGLPNGSYRILAFNRNASGTSGCTLLAEAITSDLLVTLENAVTVVAQVPDTVVTGEDLVIPLTTQQEATEAPLGNRQVTVTVAGVPAQTVTTGADGTATATISLPDLPIGDRDVTFSVAGTSGYLLGRTVEDSVKLLPRTVKVEWTGDKESLTTQPAHLQARLTDATPGSDRLGDPIVGVPVTLSIGNVDLAATTDSDGRASQTINLGAPERQLPAGASFTADDVYASASVSFTYLVKDGPPAAPNQTNGLLGGITRLVRGIAGQPSQSTPTVGAVLDNLGPPMNIGTGLNDILGSVGLAPITLLEPVDAIVESTLGGVLDTVGQVGDLADPVLESVLDVVGTVPVVGEVTETLRYDFHTTYQRPDGTSLTRSVRALLAVPTPIDVTGDTVPDIVANVTVNVSTPTIDVIKLPGAPEVLPISVQAVISGGGLVPLGDGRIRIGYDARTTSAPDRATVSLGMAGGFDLDLTTSGAQDLALVGAIEGGGLDLGFGGPTDPADVGEGETRFSINLSPAPQHTRIGLGIGGGAAGLGATFTTSAPSDITLSFAQDSGNGQLTAVNAAFETVLGSLALVLDAGSSSGGPVPELGLQLLSDNGLDRVYVSARTYDDGDLTDDLLLSLDDVPTSVVFGVADDGGLALTASEPVGLMRAGFASGGAIATLDEPAYLYLLSEDGYESVGIRLPGVSSLSANLAGENVGLELDMAPTKLRAVMDTPESALDAAIYDAPAQFGLGLAADGAFLIQGSAPIDLIVLDLYDPSGSLGGAENITVRIEDIPSLLSVSLVGGAVSFDTGGDSVGLLELVVGDAPPFTPGEDTLYANFDTNGAALAVRVHGLRTIVASLDPSAPEFLLDTTADAIMNLSISAPNADPLLPPLDVSGRIDRLKPNMSFGVASTPDGNLAGLLYKADEPSNSISFNIPGMANFTVFDPLPKEFMLLQPPAPAPLTISGSEYFTLQLNASFDGVNANINNMRIRHMEFASAEPENPSGPVTADMQAFFMNTTRFGDDCPDGCVYTMGDPTRSLATFNAGGTAVVDGTMVMGPIPAPIGNATVTITPRGMAATNAAVTMEIIQSGLSANAFHRNTNGVLHCTGNSNANGTNMTTSVLVLIITITVQMRGALCNIGTGTGTGAGVTPTPRADLGIDSVVAPANVVAGSPVVHTVTSRNIGPNPATNVATTATYDDALGDPTVACGAGGSAVFSPGAVTCTWAGATNRDAQRAIELTFPTDPSTPPGTSVSVDYTTTSATPGNSATASASSTVQADVANLTITGVSAPATAVGGEGNLVHTATVENTGPGVASNARLVASPNSALGTPTVTCSDDGVATGLECKWASVGVGESRTQTVTWAVPAGVPTGSLVVGYTASSDTPGTGDSTTATTAISTVVADLALASSSFTDRVLPGEEVVHTVTIRNDGPSAAQTARVLADYDGKLGTPAITCSEGGTATNFPELQRARCLWLGATALGGERTLTLTWTAPADTALGTTSSVAYRGTSDTPGDDVTITGSTLVAEPPIVPEPATVVLSATNGPALWAPGTNLVHTATATTGGGSPTTGLKVVADLLPGPAAVPNPTVTCSNSGTSAISGTQATCTWSTNTAPGQNRTLTLTWASASLVTARSNAAPDDAIVAVDYSATSDATGPTETQSISTTVAASVGNVNIVTASGGSGAAQANNAVLQHGASASRANPTTGNATVVITATADPALVAIAPTVSCPAAVSTTGTTLEPGKIQCTWAAGTATTARVMNLTWPIDTAPGTYSTKFEASSDVPGAWGTFTRTTQLIDRNTANINITGGSAPASILSNASMAHSATAALVAPVGDASTVVIRATSAPDLVGITPTIACPNAVPTTGIVVTPGEVWECAWAAGTATTARTMTLTYAAGTVPAGTQETVFTTSSSRPGTWNGVTRSTQVNQATVTASVNGITAPETVAPGATLVHHIDVRNVGNVSATDLRIVATHDEALGLPTVSCHGGGTATHVSSTEDRCQWTGATTSGNQIRRMTLTWDVPADQADTTVNVSYTATAASAAGVVVTPATASSTTSVVNPTPPPAPASTAPFWAGISATAPESAPPAPPAAVAPAPAPAKSCLKLVLGLKVCL